MTEKIERVDYGSGHPHFDATLKPMPTGETVARIRVRIPDMLTNRVSLTKAAQWSDVSNPPWQNPHLHRGVTEGYLVSVGWMIAVWRNADGRYRYQVVGEVSDTSPVPFREHFIVFDPCVAHNVLLGPGAEVLVWQMGTPVLNTSMREPLDRFACESFDFEYFQLNGLIQNIL